VDLQDAAGLEARVAQGVVGADHRDLDDVRAVPWITVLTASRSPSLRVCQLRAADLRDLAAAAEQRADVAVLLGLGDGVGHEPRDGREALEVAVDELLRLRPARSAGGRRGRTAERP
jgi:hypothetical protein